NDALGLHPSLRPLGRLLEAGQLAGLPGVGYPNSSRSHFRGMAVWHTARLDPADHVGYGWLGRALDPSSASSASVHENVPRALRGRRSRATALTRIDEMLLADRTTARRATGPESADDLHAYIRRQALDGYATADELAAMSRDRDAAPYPGTGLSQRLQLVARLLKANLAARVFYTVQGGYDTHA